MNQQINAKELRATLPRVVEQVRKGACITVIYRSRPAFQIVPLDHAGPALTTLEAEPLYRAGALGHSRDGHRAADHDQDLYPAEDRVASRGRGAKSRQPQRRQR